ncbi:MAG: UDP-N-acetylmuramoyl-tripeptide--D-alanyl-D-alanine ligase [Candidatus Woesebacteria bacterium]|jgi:UDP-N-acetylmuramoyl-tripeptide--D-alanyl-D-alanine ligase
MNKSHYLLSIIAFLPFIFLRLARWLAIIQQKEYRLDRFLLFLKSDEGKKDFLKLLPKAHELNRSGLKRPVLTKRILLVAMLTTLITAGILLVDTLYPIFILIIFLIYLLLPLIIFIATLPTALVFELTARKKLNQAATKIKAAKPLIIGITGSYGKTTTKLILAHVLKQKFKTFATEKSFNTKYSLPLSILKNYHGQEIAIIEYAAYTQGEIKFLTKYFKPNITIITGLTAQHLGLFGTVDNIIQAKAELIRALDDKSLVFCNAIDLGSKQICQAGAATKSIAFSGDEAVVKIKDVGLNERAELYFTWKGQKIQTKLIGEHYLDAIKASIAVAKHLKMTDQDITKALKSLKVTDYMIKLKKGKNQSLIIDDGKTSNPTGFKAALDILQQFSNKKIVLITSGIVDLGKLSSEIHMEIASKAEKIVDLLLYTGLDGQEEFKSVFGARFENQKTVIKNSIQYFDENTVILIEGHIPQWVRKEL